MTTIATLAAQNQTLEPILVFDIISKYDGTVLRISTVKTVFGGNTYLPYILQVSGFQIQLENSQLGVAAIPEISLTLGNADASLSNWDSAHYFKNSRIIATFVFHDPSTGQVGSSDSLTAFIGVCNAPDQDDDLQLVLSAFNRFTSQLLLLPFSRISQTSQTVFPGDGRDDADTASPTDTNSAAYAWVQSDTDRSRPDWTCGYGPMRGSFGFGGANPLGNWKLAPTASPDTHTSATIGKTGLGMTVDDMAGHIVIITAGTGAGQSRRILSNTATVLTVANAFTTPPDGTSTFAVAFGFCGKSKADCDARGMDLLDSSSRTTKRFRGISIVPEVYLSRLYQTTGHPLIDPDQAKYNQVMPRVYGGPVRISGQILFALTDTKNLSGHIFFCEGEITSLSNLIVNNKTIPFQQSPSQAQLTGSYTCVLGARGANAIETRYPTQDPYGLMAVVYIIILPLAFTSQSTSFQSTALVTGRKVESVDKTGASLGWAYSANPAWALYDILKDCGWPASDINLESFHSYSAYADQFISADTGNGTTIQAPRFSIAMYISSQRAASDVIAGLMGAGRMILSYDNNGQLRLDCENKLANTTLNVAVTTTGSAVFARVNDGAGITVGVSLAVDSGGSAETVSVLSVRAASGNFAFEFEAVFAHTHSIGATVIGATAFDFDDTNILFDESSGLSSLVKSAQKTPDVPNQYTVEFYNTQRNNAQDSVVLTDTREANSIGALLTGQLPADGFPIFDQALRAERLALYKGHGATNQDGTIRSSGNLYVTLSTSVKGIFIRIGSIVSVTKSSRGWTKKLFRVISIDPSGDSTFPYWQIKYVLREHDDYWYDDINNTPAAQTSAPTPTGPGGGGGGGTGGGPNPRLPIL